MFYGGADIIITEIKCTINVMHWESSWNHPHPRPGLWKRCLPENLSLMPKWLGTAAVKGCTLWYINYILIKLQLKIQKEKQMTLEWLKKNPTEGKDLNFSPTGCVVLSKLLNLSASQIYQPSSEYLISLRTFQANCEDPILRSYGFSPRKCVQS